MDNAVLHKYLIKVNLKNLIPRKFLLNYADPASSNTNINETD